MLSIALHGLQLIKRIQFTSGILKKKQQRNYLKDMRKELQI